RLYWLFQPDRTIKLMLTKLVRGGQSTLAETTLAGVTYEANRFYWVELAATGANPALLGATLWVDGTPEPSTHGVTAADAEPALKAAGFVGLSAWVGPAATNPLPLAVTWDDLKVRAYSSVR